LNWDPPAKYSLILSVKIAVSRDEELNSWIQKTFCRGFSGSAW